MILTGKILKLQTCRRLWRTEGGGLGDSTPPPPEIPKVSVASSIA